MTTSRSVAKSWVPPSVLADRIDPEFYRPEALAAARWITSGVISTDRLADLADLLTDGVHASPDFTTSGPLYLTATNIQPFHLDISKGYKRISEATFLRHARGNCAPHAKDVLLAKSGRIGVAAVTPPRLKFSVLHSAAIVRFGETTDPYWTTAVLNSRVGQDQIRRFQKGTAQPMLHLEDIAEIRIPRISPQIQHAIGNKIRKAERLREFAGACRAEVECEISSAYGEAPDSDGSLVNWVSTTRLSLERLDGWFHRTFFYDLCDGLKARAGFQTVQRVVKLVKSSASLPFWPSGQFPYFEIGGIDSATGAAKPEWTAIADAPSRAKFKVIAGDVLVSTVRPSLKAFGQISRVFEGAGVASSGFAVLRAETPELGAYVRACLAHEAGTAQLMRWNTGGAYPAIDSSVPLKVLIPWDGQAAAVALGQKAIAALEALEETTALFESAKSAVESLIDGQLDSDALFREDQDTERWLQQQPTLGDGSV